jgi:hypothetical protein
MGSWRWRGTLSSVLLWGRSRSWGSGSWTRSWSRGWSRLREEKKIRKIVGNTISTIHNTLTLDLGMIVLVRARVIN